MKKIFILSITLILISGTALAAVPEKSLPEKSLLDGVKPGPDGKIDVVTVFAHPDDESFYVGGTLLKLKEDPRVRLHIVCMTNGDKDRAKDVLRITPADLAAIRSKELEAAATVLHADELIQLGYPDQGLASADKDKLIEQVLDILNRDNAAIVITADPFGLSGHPDHTMSCRTATAAFEKSSAQRLFYVTIQPYRYAIYKAIYNAVYKSMAPFKSNEERARPDLRVHIRDEKRLKKLALHSHASQNTFSFYNGLEMKLDLLYNYEYFKLAGTR